jgi:hypothetical protein
MPAVVDVRCPASAVSESQQRAIEAGAVSLPDGWRLTLLPEATGGYRLRADGPGHTTSRAFDHESAPVEITKFLNVVREHLTR